MVTDVTGVVLEECGHWVPEEKPLELASRLAEFIHQHMASPSEPCVRGED